MTQEDLVNLYIEFAEFCSRITSDYDKDSFADFIHWLEIYK